MLHRLPARRHGREGFGLKIGLENSKLSHQMVHTPRSNWPHVCIHAYLHVCTWTRVHMYACIVCMHAYIRMHVCMYACMHVRVHVRVPMYVCMHMYAHLALNLKQQLQPVYVDAYMIGCAFKHIHPCIHAHICTYTHTRTHARAHTNTHAHAQKHACARICACARKRTLYVCTLVRPYVRAYARVYVHTYMHRYIYIHTCMHACIRMHA